MAIESRNYNTRSTVLFQANRLRHIEEIGNPRKVAHINPITELVHRGEIAEAHAADKVVGRILWKLKKGETILIEDGSHGEVVFINPTSRRAKRLQIGRIHRFGRMEDETMTINSPRLQGSFIKGPFRDDFSLVISGTRPGQKKGDEGEVVRITSNGNFYPRPFIITTQSEVVLARVDRSGSPTCALEYQGGTKWLVRGR